MEASAFLQVCEHLGVHAFGIIKGVSDMGDDRKSIVGNDQHYKPALRRAADAAKRFTEWYLTKHPLNEPDLSQ